MKIGIVGPPEVGKSKLATALAERLSGETDIIDDYIKEVSEESDLWIDPNATYIGNLYVILGRYARERQANLSDAEHRITCGTFIDSAIYSSIQAVGSQSPANQKSELLWTRITNLMNILGTFYQDTYDYDLMLVLKYDDLSNVSEAAANMNSAIDMALNSFGIQYFTLTGDTEAQVEQAIAAIKKQEEEEADAQEPEIPQPSPLD